MFEEVTEGARRWQDYLTGLPIFFTFGMTVRQKITGFTYYGFFVIITKRRVFGRTWHLGVIRNEYNTKSAFIENFTHRKLTFCYVHYTTIYRPNFQGSRWQRTALSLNMRPISFPETSVTNLRWVRVQKNADQFTSRRRPESTPTYNTFYKFLIQGQFLSHRTGGNIKIIHRENNAKWSGL
jgi:hypothetical protein